MSELTATETEARTNFSKIASTVNNTKQSVTVLKDSKPWVIISPANNATDVSIPKVDWSRVDVIKVDPALGYALLPADLDDDKGLYDDLV